VPPTTAADRPTPTLPESVEPGTGALVLGDEAGVLTVTSCELVPSIDPATGVTTEVAVAAHDGTGRTVDVLRTSFTADVPTVTDTVTVTDPGGAVVESSRVDAGGRLIDLRLENAVGRLIEVDGDVVRADGVFGQPASVAASTDVDGELLLRCP
jgi:hypothetical protein